MGGLNQHGARTVGKVAGEARLEPCRFEQCRHRLRLVIADLDRGQPAGRDQPPDVRRQAAIFVEAFGTGKQGLSRFVLGERTIEVDDLLDRWYGERVDYFRVRGMDGHFYVLKHVRCEDLWELTSFTRSESSGTSIGTAAPRVLH